MQALFLEYVSLILIILALVMLANRLRVAYPIVLVTGGLLISLAGWYANLAISPEVVFFIFLPPLLAEAAWQISWKEFWRWRRVIASFAFPIVILTSTVVALAASWMIPGFTLALGFLLGGIISPPDAISATTIMRRVQVPRALLSIAEGESLLNDASSLIVFRFALAAVITGQFHFQQAAASFFLVIVLGSAIGLCVGGLFYAVYRWLPTTASIETVITLVAPYCMYFAAEHFHYSGVLAVVSGTLLLARRRNTILTYESRLQGINVWDNFVFVLNGLVFLLIGLQLPHITKGLGSISLPRAIGYGLAISALLIVLRLLCTLGASLFTRMMSRVMTVADNNPGWRGPFVLGWAGMRGVVSLAAALSVPVLVDDKPFPFRSLILLITFVVILVTLVFQGLTLPWVIRKVHPEDRYSPLDNDEQERIIQKKLALHSLQFLEERHGSRPFADSRLENLAGRFQLDGDFFGQKEPGDERTALRDFQLHYLELLEQQRQWLRAINRRDEFDEAIIRKHISLIDMEEYKMREKLLV